MTREELLEEIERQQKWLDGAGYTAYNIDIAFLSLRKNIKALEEPCKDTISKQSVIKAVDAHTNADGTLDEDISVILEELQPVEPKTDVLNKIRAEIIEEKDCAYADFERYKVEYLNQDWDEVYDSLPRDDFRFGMERVVDIIDKYRK